MKKMAVGIALALLATLMSLVGTQPATAQPDPAPHDPSECPRATGTWTCDEGIVLTAEAGVLQVILVVGRWWRPVYTHEAGQDLATSVAFDPDDFDAEITGAIVISPRRIGEPPTERNGRWYGQLHYVSLRAPDCEPPPTNRAPVAVAAADAAEVEVGTAVTLDGSGSSDPDSDALSYAWSVTAPAGSVATFDDAAGVAPTFTPDAAGAYEFSLVVSDGQLESPPAVVAVTATPPPVGQALTLEVTDSVLGLGRQTTATVVLDAPAPVGGTPVDLAIDDPAIAGLAAASVTVPAGAATAQVVLDGLTVGSTTVRATSPGLPDASAAIEVTETLISIDQIERIAPEGSSSVVISITDPAPAQGLVINLEVADPAIATVSPATVFVPAGQFTPVQNAQLTGVTLGSTSLRASAVGYAADTRTATVAIGAVWEPATIEVAEGRTVEARIRLDAAAPAEGLTFTLSTPNGLVTAPTEVTVPGGQTVATVTFTAGTTVGPDALVATAVGIGDFELAVDVVPGPAAFLIRRGFPNTPIDEAIVGVELQGEYQIALDTLPAQPVDVVVSVDAASGVLLSPNRNVLGSDRVEYPDVVDFATGLLVIQGEALDDDVDLTIEIFERNTTNPADYAIRPATVDIDPSGAFFTSNDFTVDQLDVRQSIGATVAVLYDDEGPQPVGTVRENQAARVGGPPLRIAVASSDPAVVAANPSEVTIAGGSAQGSWPIVPVAPGTATFTLASVPDGFEPVVGARTSVAVTVTGTEAWLAPRGTNIATSEAVIGLDLQAQYQIRMQSAPPRPVDVVISVDPAAGVLLATDSSEVGTDQVRFDNYTQGATPGFWIQGEAIGDDVELTIEILETGTDTPAPYAVRPATVDVDPSGVYLTTPDFTASVFDARRSVEARIGVLFDDEGPGPVGGLNTTQVLRAGESVDFTLTSSDPAVAQANPSVATVDQGSVGTFFDLEFGATGSATVSLTDLPPDFSVVTERLDGEVVVTVVGATAHLSPRGFPAVITGEAIVGVELQRAYQVVLDTAPPFPVNIEVSVPAGTGSVLLSDSPTTGGGEAVEFSDVVGAGTPPLYIQGVRLDDDVPLAIAVFRQDTGEQLAYNVSPTTVDIDPTGIGFDFDTLATTTFSPNPTLRAQLWVLTDDEDIGPVGTRRVSLPVRGGTELSFTATSSAPNVAELVEASIVVRENELNILPQIDPLTAGTTVIAWTGLPPGITTTLDTGQVTVTVDAPDLTLVRSGTVVSEATIGENLQLDYRIGLQVEPPNPVDVTVTVADGSSVLVSSDPAVEGAASITFPGVTDFVQGLYVQGIAEGTATQLRITAPGFDDWIVDVDVGPSGFIFTQVAARVSEGDTVPVSIQPVALTDALNIFQRQAVRGGVSVDVGLVSDDTAVATVTPVVTLANGAESGTGELTGVSAGTAGLSITQPPGYTEPIETLATVIPVTVDFILR